jgi:alkane 1-monooxygenase
MMLQLGLVGGLVVAGGPWVAAAFAAQAAFAVFLLEYINYIRHYGLVRAVGERQTERHSWQAEERWSRWTLLELTRHPAHHLKASEPFWRLQPYEHAPELPSGYYGCFWLAVVPPLWRRVIHPRIPEAFIPA